MVELTYLTPFELAEVLFVYNLFTGSIIFLYYSVCFPSVEIVIPKLIVVYCSDLLLSAIKLTVVCIANL